VEQYEAASTHYNGCHRGVVIAHKITTSKSSAIETSSVNSVKALRMGTQGFLRIYYWDFSLKK